MDKLHKRFFVGYLLFIIVMFAIGYLMWVGFGLLGYSHPKEAPALLRYAGLMVFLVTMVIVFNVVGGDTYNQLQERRRQKKERSEDLGH